MQWSVVEARAVLWLKAEKIRFTWGLRFEVQGLGFRLWDLGFREKAGVEGFMNLGFRV